MRGGLFPGICPVWIALGESLGVKREGGGGDKEKKMLNLPADIMSLVNLDLHMSDSNVRFLFFSPSPPFPFSLPVCVCACVCVQ